jgi:hypothetical protein
MHDTTRTEMHNIAADLDSRAWVKTDGGLDSGLTFVATDAHG